MYKTHKTATSVSCSITVVRTSHYIVLMFCSQSHNSQEVIRDADILDDPQAQFLPVFRPFQVFQARRQFPAQHVVCNFKHGLKCKCF